MTDHSGQSGDESSTASLITFPANGHSSSVSSGPATSSDIARKPDPIISFDRKELDQLLSVYGFKVGDGEWRDYAIDMLKDRAVFSVFQRQGDVPLYQIEKNPRLARKQGAYSIINAGGQILKRGHELRQVLSFFDRRPKLRTV